MPKTNLNDILKGGDNFKIRKIDELIEEFDKMMESIKKEQEIIKKRTKKRKK